MSLTLAHTSAGDYTGLLLDFSSPPIAAAGVG